MWSSALTQFLFEGINDDPAATSPQHTGRGRAHLYAVLANWFSTPQQHQLHHINHHSTVVLFYLPTKINIQCRSTKLNINK